MTITERVWVVLIEPSGIDNVTCTMQFAVDFCNKTQGWTWRHAD